MKGHFGQSVPKNGPPSGQTATYQKTKDIQSYLRIWGTYDPIGLDMSDPKMALFEPKMLFFGPGSHPDIPIGFGVQAVSCKTSIYFIINCHMILVELKSNDIKLMVG